MKLKQCIGEVEVHDLQVFFKEKGTEGKTWVLVILIAVKITRADL